MDDEYGIIKINIDIFYNLLKTKEDDDTELPSALINKSKDLQNNYNCFASNYDARSLWEKKKFIATKIRNKDFKSVRAKPLLHCSDFSEEAKFKKEFTGYLNKLSDVNKNVIYNKIKIFINTIDKQFIPLLFDIIWLFIKKSSNIIYIDVLYLFNEDVISESIKILWDKYLKDHEWIPPDYVLNRNILLKDENYDDFCEYIKWKKSSLSIIRAWCYIFKKEDKIYSINYLLYNIIDIIKDHISGKNIIKKHVLDIALDQINTILDSHKNEEVFEIISEWDHDSFESSSKFKLLTILEKYNK